MTRPEFSVIVPTHNKARYLDLSLASWCGQEWDDYELLVIDDGSTDQTAAVLGRYQSELPIQAMRVPHSGRSAARNHGLHVARGSRIVFVDDDRIVPPGFLRAHRDSVDSDEVIIGWQHGLLVDLRNHGDQHIAPERIASLLRDRPAYVADALDGGSGVLLTVESLKDQEFDIEALRLEDPWEPYLERMIRVYGEDLAACPLAWACGTTGNMSVSREFLQRTGGFDTRFGGWGLEDTELHYRLAKGGAHIRVVRAARNYHQNHAKDGVANRGAWARNAKLFLSKHETLEVALYIHAETGNIPHLQACEVISEARRMGECSTVDLLRRLTINSASGIISHLGSLSER